MITLGLLSLTLRNCKSIILIILITIVAMLVNEGKLDISFQRHGISANRSISAQKTKTDTKSSNQNDVNDKQETQEYTEDQEEKSLKQTPNPKVMKDSKDERNPDSSDETDELKQTPNPRINNGMVKEVSQSPKTIQPIFSSMNIEDYTPEGMEKKIQERVFEKKEITQHSSDERARLLNSLYSDLISENYKKDPYLRKEASTGCESIKGTVNIIKHNDC